MAGDPRAKGRARLSRVCSILEGRAGMVVSSGGCKRASELQGLERAVESELGCPIDPISTSEPKSASVPELTERGKLQAG